MPDKRAAYLVFPNALRGFHDRKIIGIKYDLVRTPGPVGKLVKDAPEQKAAVARPRPHPEPFQPERPATPSVGHARRIAGAEPEFGQKRAMFKRSQPPRTDGRPDKTPTTLGLSQHEKEKKRFAVTIRFTGVRELTLEVVAGSKAEAAKNAGKSVQTPDFSGATVTRKILKVKNQDS